uniref:amidohydrolase n=1 Tax=Pararhizobium sp. IMCC3301 TaxID=3067904 RepID=UPI002740FB07|nr:amidohydrolase [Pararhizobium sp. IMCC3301]
MLQAADLAALTRLRQTLHQAPELSGEEVKTARFIATWLEEFSPDEIITGLGGHGVAAIYYSRRSGPTILIRCELDALPIVEISDRPYRSQQSGTAHLCGHDGHMAIVCAVAMILHGNRPQTGRVVLLFQPAEETGAGAEAVIADPDFARIQPDFAFAMHNVPGFNLGEVYLKSGALNCASRGMRVRFEGRTSHASNPEDGVSPMTAMTVFMNGITAMSRGGKADDEFVLTTIVHAFLGEAAFGIAPGAAEVWTTLRTATEERMRALVVASEQLARTTAADAGLSYFIRYQDIFPTCHNDVDATQMVVGAAQAENIPCHLLDAPMRWSEDFGAFGRHCKAAMFFLGSGTKQPQLHNPDFDFPDALIGPAARIFIRIIKNVL